VGAGAFIFVKQGVFTVREIIEGDIEMLDFSNYDILTFDCYGTLIDWEAGILSVLKPMLSRHGEALADSEILEQYGDYEAAAERHYQSYEEVLRSVARAFGTHLSFEPTAAELDALARSISQWQPWPDTVRALHKLRSRYQLAIISNIDDHFFSATLPRLQTDFQSVTTAQQARCYKPGMAIFKLALERVKVPPHRVLHVGQSIFHDVLPAQALGLSTVWINRPSRRNGVGAVKRAEGKPDLELPDLQSLAALAVGR
jgi:2-haloacid dehalogenase